MSDRLTIVVPMAGRGSRFADAGYELPKPLIPIHDIPMIELVIANITPSRPHDFVFLVLQEHLQAHNIAEVLERSAPGCSIVPVDGVTAGAAATVLLAREFIDEDPLMIANTDQWVDIDVDEYLAIGEGVDGLIMTMKADDPKWSYARLDDSGEVVEVIEKVVVSDEATVGIYNFASGLGFVRSADAMIDADERVLGEFYVAPVYNRLIRAGAHVRVHSIGREHDGMYGLGIPADLNAFLTHDASRVAVSRALTLRQRNASLR